MGWDAYADLKGERDWKNDSIIESPTQKNQEQKIFLNAYKNIKNEVGFDFYPSIKRGHVGGHLVDIHLIEATNTIISKKGYSNVYGTKWSAEQVRIINKYAEWWRNTYEDEMDRLAFNVAKYFLKACAKAGVGITFSY